MREEYVTAKEIADAVAEHAIAVHRNSKKRGQTYTHLLALGHRGHIQTRDEEKAA